MGTRNQTLLAESPTFEHVDQRPTRSHAIGVHRRIRRSAGQVRGNLRGAFLELYSHISSSLPDGYALPPLQVILELTHRCNLFCGMCYVYREIDQKNVGWNRRELSEDEIVHIVDGFPPGTRFTFTGGEPFVRKEIMSILKRTRASHRCGIGTNGALLSDTRCRELVDLGIDFLQVSLDGPEEVHDVVRGIHGTFTKTVEAIRQIQELKRVRRSRRPWLYANCTITALNVHALDRVVDLADQLGVEHVTFQVCSSSTNKSGVQVDEDLDGKIGARLKAQSLDVAELRRQLSRIVQRKDRNSPRIWFQGKMSPSEVLGYYQGQFDLSRERCIFPWVNAFVSPYGEMFPCYGYSVGDAKGGDPLKTWNGKRFREFRMKLRQAHIFPGCLGCPHMRRHGGW
ncbi:MAG: radical SAM protein [Chloroflexi bacterium]|nr:radical SAM protein [Chloroflexota bacterium]